MISEASTWPVYHNVSHLIGQGKNLRAFPLFKCNHPKDALLDLTAIDEFHVPIVPTVRWTWGRTPFISWLL